MLFHRLFPSKKYYYLLNKLRCLLFVLVVFSGSQYFTNLFIIIVMKVTA